MIWYQNPMLNAAGKIVIIVPFAHSTRLTCHTSAYVLIRLGKQSRWKGCTFPKHRSGERLGNYMTHEGIAEVCYRASIKPAWEMNFRREAVSIENSCSFFFYDSNNLLALVVWIGGAIQKVISMTLLSRIVYLSHDPEPHGSLWKLGIYGTIWWNCTTSFSFILKCPLPLVFVNDFPEALNLMGTHHRANR